MNDSCIKDSARASIEKAEWPAVVLDIPEIRFPFPSAAGNRKTQLDSMLLEWAQHCGLVTGESAVERFRRCRFSGLADAVHPFSERASIAGKWYIWLFFFDDQFDENLYSARAERFQPLVDHLLEQLPLDGKNTRTPPSGPLATALADWWATEAIGMPEPWKQRLRAHIGDYLMSYGHDIATRRYGAAPAFEQFAPFRRHNGAIDSVLDILELVNGICLPNDVVASEHISVLREIGNDVICWTNDIISFNKEYARGELNNLVAVLRESGGTWNQAAEQAVILTKARAEEFVEACHDLRESGDYLAWTDSLRQDVERFLSAVEYWISGSLRWHLDSPRFRAEHVEAMPAERLLDAELDVSA